MTQGFPFPPRRMLAATLIAFALAGCEPKIDPAQTQKAIQEGVKFLEANRQKPGVAVTPSGLQYQVLQEGTGASPTASDIVSVNYRGMLISGSTFDQGEDIRFPLNQVIPGWTEGLQLMKEGAKYRFFIPSELAYGERGAGRVIPPNAPLIFEVELRKVNPS